jgi:hypothetical protein
VTRFQRLDQLDQQGAGRRRHAQLRALGDHAALDRIDLRATPGPYVLIHRGPRVRDLAGELSDPAHRVVIGELDALGGGDGHGFLDAGARDAPGPLVGTHLAGAHAGHRADRAERDVRDQLAPDHGPEVVKQVDGEAGLAPGRADPLQAHCDAPRQLGEIDRLHAVVMDVAGRHDLGAEAAGDAEQEVVAPRRLLDALDVAQAVLDREHQAVRPDHWRGAAHRILDVHDLGGDDHELARASLGGIGRGAHLDRAIAARPLAAQALAAHRLDMLPPSVEHP